MNLIDVDVPGTPQTKGSARGFPVRRKSGRMGVAITNDNPNAKEWQHRIAFFAKAQMGDRQLEEGRVVVHASFRFRRPKSHLLKAWDPSKTQHQLRKGVSFDHVQKPDIDKLARVVLDALKGVCYHDDAQVSGVSLLKYWTQRQESGVHIRVEVRDA